MNTTVKDIPLERCVMDTGPLLSMLVLEYIRVNGIAEPKRFSLLKNTDNWLSSLGVADRYRTIFGRIKQFYTTSHAIGELSGLVSSRLKLEGDDKRSFWSTTASFFGSEQRCEQCIHLNELYQKNDSNDPLWEIGIVDMGVLELARSFGLPILTFDRKTLGNYANKWKINVVILEDLL